MHKLQVVTICSGGYAYLWNKEIMIRSLIVVGLEGDKIWLWT